MKKCYFSLYTVNDFENDIEIKGTFDTFKDLEDFLDVSKQYLIKIGLKKKQNFNIEITIKKVKYKIYVDKEV